MTFEDLKEQLKDRFEEFRGQLENSPAFNTLKEKYENLSTNAQKTLIWSGVVVATLLLFSCPMSFRSSSSTNIAKYQEVRSLIRDLLHSSSLANQMDGGADQVTMDGLQGMIQARLADSRLLPEQMAGIQNIDPAKLGSSLAPAGITQEALQVSLKKLNLKQIVELGYKLQDMHASVKLAGFNIMATAENDHYFDVVFQMIRFSLPMSEQDLKQQDEAGDEGE